MKEPLIVGPHTEEYIRDLLPDYTGFPGEIAKNAAERRLPVIQPEAAKLLEVLIKGNKTESILEIGTAVGFSAILFALCMGPKGKIDTIEIDPEMVSEAISNIKKSELQDRINVIEGDALSLLPEMRGRYDMIFLDGPKGQYLKLLPDCIRLLKDSGYLITDNTFYRGMVAVEDERIPRRRRTMVRKLREYIEAICNHPQLETSLIPISDGMALSVKRQDGIITI